jgi:hypothetical protein
MSGDAVPILWRSTAPPPVRLVGRNARGALHQRTNAPGAMQIDATDADEAVASADVAYPHHGGCTTDVRRLIAGADGRSRRESPQG